MQARAFGQPAPGAWQANPLLLGLSPSDAVRRAVASVRTADLEQALLLLPFSSALLLLELLPAWLRDASAGAELACSVSVLLLRLHQRQLAATTGARGVLLALRAELRPRLEGLRETVGGNIAAIEGLQRFHTASMEEM